LERKKGKERRGKLFSSFPTSENREGGYHHMLTRSVLSK